MKTLKLKTTLNGNGNATLAHPNAPLKETAECIIYLVNNIPDEISTYEVIRRFNSSCQISGKVFDFNQLHLGAIIHGTE
jgi:hypothetical protein